MKLEYSVNRYCREQMQKLLDDSNATELKVELPEGIKLHVLTNAMYGARKALGESAKDIVISRTKGEVCLRRDWKDKEDTTSKDAVSS